MAVFFVKLKSGNKNVFVSVRKPAFELLYKELQTWTKTEIEARIIKNARDFFITHPTGDLARSFHAIVKRTTGGAASEVYSRLKYAGIQNLGGTINAKPGGALTIPLDAAKTAAGSTRQGAGSIRDQINSMVSSGKFESTFIKNSKRGNALIFGVPAGKPDEIVPLFLLVKQVKLRGTLYAEIALLDAPEFSDWVQPRLLDLLTRGN